MPRSKNATGYTPPPPAVATEYLDVLGAPSPAQQNLDSTLVGSGTRIQSTSTSHENQVLCVVPFLARNIEATLLMAKDIPGCDIGSGAPDCSLIFAAYVAEGSVKILFDIFGNIPENCDILINAMVSLLRCNSFFDSTTNKVRRHNQHSPLPKKLNISWFYIHTKSRHQCKYCVYDQNEY